MKLYVYDHCPFCVKARMIFGLKNLAITLVFLLNDDEQTPISKIGQKMLPILQKQNGSYMPESMDIIHYIDQLDGRPILTGKTNPAINQWIQEINQYSRKLVYPRFIKAGLAEFATEEAKQYFIHKKQKNIGDFEENLAHSAPLIEQLQQDLVSLSSLIKSHVAVNGEISEDDIHLFASLRSLSVIKGIVFPQLIDNYVKHMVKRTEIPLLLAV